MGKSSKAKGAVYERRIVKLHTEHEIPCHKTPLSGAMAAYPGDVQVGAGGDRKLRGEIKARKNANGFKVIREWLGENDLLFLQEIETPPRANPDPLVCMPFSLYVELLSALRSGS